MRAPRTFRTLSLFIVLLGIGASAAWSSSIEPARSAHPWDPFAVLDSTTAARLEARTSPFRGAPGLRRSWAIVECGIARQPERHRPEPRPVYIFDRIDRTTAESDEYETALVLGFGFMRNVGPSWAGGFGAEATIDGMQDRLALKPRARHWLGRAASVELAAGPIVAVQGGSGYHRPFWSSTLSLNTADYLSIGFGLETPQFGRPGDTSKLFFVRLGSYPGLAAMTAAGGMALLVGEHSDTRY